ncbi:aminopeptidase N-like [Ostrinia nubilalis]|uniref:aminopeptidase N-like n=1 Tax=Ostrinia nubilalis TaxID=29057 RepID=UPI0030823CD6
MWRSCVTVLLALQWAVAHEYLLPGDVHPSHYDLRVTYDIDPATNFSFFGVVDILLSTVKPTSKIILHAQDFSIASQAVTLTGQDAPGVMGAAINDTYNFLTVSLDKNLEVGHNYTLTIPFYGNLKTGLDGVYISQYVNKNTKSKEYLITTQFEAISARKGFPCFDEPMYKATFKITLGHHQLFTAVSNMPVKTSYDQNIIESYWPWHMVGQKFRKSKSDFVWDEFDTSVPMSTYLVAFVVSKFSHVESPPNLSTTKFRIWARSDAIDQTAYAANIGPRVLDHFEKFFNVSFPLPKQDMFAIPDFAAGAMENWGLITYRETTLLFDKKQSSFVSKERVAEVIAHELAHQWFGNLVTMKWWSDLWLNEGFATFMASVGVAAVEPTWRADQGYAVENLISVLGLDALESSHPVSVPIDDPKRINEIFDEISYRKGSTLIRMMTMFLGEEVFRKALHNYLVKYSYQNAAQDALWEELTAASRQYGTLARDVTVKEVMDTWTKQTGYPVLTVTRDYSDNTLAVTQKRYLNMGSRGSTDSSWWVPLKVLCQSEASSPTGDLQWLADDEGVSTQHRFEHGAGAEEWVLFNYDMIAPYRVNYDKRNWQLLVGALTGGDHHKLPVLGRVQLLSDAFALAWNNQLDYNTALQLASYLKHETEYLPLSNGLNVLAKLESVLRRSPDYGAFQKFVRRLITDTYRQSGGLAAKQIINGDDLNSVKMQTTLSSWACRMNVPGCQENALELFQDWMNSPRPDEDNPIPLDLRRTVYCEAMARGGVREWRFALARVQRSNVAAARDVLLRGLACTREIWILAQYLEWAITEGSEVRRQDAALVVTSITRSSVGYYVAKEFIYTRIQDIYKAFSSQSRRLGSIIKILLDQFTTQKDLDEFLAWYKDNTQYLEEAKLAVQQAIEKATVNIHWLNKNRHEVVDKLREFSTDAPSEEGPIVSYTGSHAGKTSVGVLGLCTHFLIIHIL